MAVSILYYGVQLGASVGRVVHALGAFNYQLVKSIIRLLQDGCKGMVVVALAIGTACADICNYLVDFGAEVFQFLYVCLLFLSKIATLLSELAAAFYSGIQQLAQYLGGGLLAAMRYGYSSILDFLDYTKLSSLSLLYLKDCLCSIGSYCWLHIRAWFSAGTNLFLWLTHSFSDCVKYSSFVAWDSITVVIYGIASGIHTLYEVLLSTVLACWTFGCGVAWNAANAIYDVLCSAVSLATHATSSIPPDVCIVATVSLIAIFLMNTLVRFMRKQGLTFPLLQPAQTVIHLDGDFDEDVLEISEEEEEIGSDSGNNSESDDDIVPSDEDDDVSVSIINLSDEDSVEEFEVAENDTSEGESDSEGEENNPNIINIQLPIRRTRSGLRARATPSPGCGMEKLTPSELEKRLEYEHDKHLCVVCQYQVKNVLVLPCRHMCMCVDCAHEIAHSRARRQRICPLCRGHITTVMNVYL